MAQGWSSVKDVTPYNRQGLTEYEVSQVLTVTWTLKPASFIEAQKLFVEHGYPCQEIAQRIKGLNTAELLKARVDFGWDDARQRHLENVEQQAKNNLPHSRIRALSFLDSWMQATELKYKARIAAFCANPENERLPDFAEINSYLDTLKRLDETMQQKSKDGKAAVEQHTTPIIVVMVTTADVDKAKTITATVEVDQMDLKRQMMLEAGLIPPSRT